MDYKIYLYNFINRPKTVKTPWEDSQIYNIEIPHFNDEYSDCLVYQTAGITKLFISTTTKFHKFDSATTISQWDLTDLSKMMNFIIYLIVIKRLILIKIYPI